MTDDSAATVQRGERLPWVKPFVRNLDMTETEGKPTYQPSESSSDLYFNLGPS
jgi:hypothetical protein